MSSAIIQSAVNVSEGRRKDVITRIVAAAGSAPHAVVANWSADPDHNRMVVTILGPPKAVAASVFALAQVAVDNIDMNCHEGVHPRTGALDVVPFTPLREVTMADCIELSMEVASKLAGDCGIPVFLYEQSARPQRPASLPDIRRGGYEKIAATDLSGSCEPDFGPSKAHPTAGISIVGARPALVAYNVDLGSESVEVAHTIARTIRRSRDELQALDGVRSMGLYLPRRGCAQVSMNLTKPYKTNLPSVFQFVKTVAAELDCSVNASEVIGLVPQSCIHGAPFTDFLWHGGSRDQIVETWLQKIS